METENEEKKVTIDLRKVMVEENIGMFTETDLSKPVGNMVHQQAGDIALDDMARKLYYEGVVEVEPRMARMMSEIVMNAGLKLFVKQALQKIFDESLKV